MSRPLILERRGQADKTGKAAVGGARLEIAPPISADYWAYRVRLTETQAIVGFPKFGVIGIGFAKEEDWNTNLPSHIAAEEIYEHIEHNKLDESIAREDCIAAIELVRAAVEADRPVKS